MPVKICIAIFHWFQIYNIILIMIEIADIACQTNEAENSNRAISSTMDEIRGKPFSFIILIY